MPPPLNQLFSPSSLILNLDPTTREEAIDRLLDTLQLAERAKAEVRSLLGEREAQGSTALGLGVALPHIRSDVVPSLCLAYGRSAAGIDWEAPDDQPVHHLFLLVAPPISDSKDYLPVMGNIARLVREDEVRQGLAMVETPDEFVDLLKAHGC